MNIEMQLALVDAILAEFRTTIGMDFDGYRNHVYRVINLCYSLEDFGSIEKEKIQIAACFHDIGIWTARTLDYLPPSETEASQYLKAHVKEQWSAEILEMIEMHHRIRPCTDSAYPLVEAFRHADIADFSLGVVRMGIPREIIRQVKAAFPNAGFHKRLVQLGSKWLFQHPLNPLPMFRR
jgi:hypothetical protein